MIDVNNWADFQRNAPLRSRADVDIASGLLTYFDLPLHGDRVKNWDSFLAVHFAPKDRASPVFDAGACRDPRSPSAFLPGMRKLGYTSLTGMNLDEPSTETVVDGVTYRRGNIEDTLLPYQSFDYITSLSTIEHGVNTRHFFAECARLLRPRGRVFVSFDYWHDPIDTGDRSAFGVPVRIFDSRAVGDMIEHAERDGLKLVGSWWDQCDEKVVNWIGLDYTFLNLLFEKHPGH